MTSKRIVYLYLSQSDVEHAIKDYVKRFAGEFASSEMVISCVQAWNFTVSIEEK